MKIFFCFLLLVILSSLFANEWDIDQVMRFQFAYIPDGKNPVSGEDVETAPSLGFTANYNPDIDNIPLSGIKSLGFTLPDRENNDQYKLYLKLFHFPASWNAQIASSMVFKEFYLDKLPRGEELLSFASKGENLAVKLGFIEKADRVFSPENPYPSLIVEKNNRGFEKKFHKNVLFYSLYVLPQVKKELPTEEEKAAYSAYGVVSMHKQIVALYQRELEEFKGEEPEKFYYFRKPDTSCCGKGAMTSLVFKVQKNPFVFGNWKDLPMPSNPKKHFLSGLLLIYRSEKNAQSPLASETVFEVGSLIRLP